MLTTFLTCQLKRIFGNLKENVEYALSNTAADWAGQVGTSDIASTDIIRIIILPPSLRPWRPGHGVMRSPAGGDPESSHAIAILWRISHGYLPADNQNRFPAVCDWRCPRGWQTWQQHDSPRSTETTQRVSIIHTRRPVNTEGRRWFWKKNKCLHSS